MGRWSKYDADFERRTEKKGRKKEKRLFSARESVSSSQLERDLFFLPTMH